MHPIKFEVPCLSKKVHNRYRRYAAWFRKPWNTLLVLLLFLLSVGMLVVSLVRYGHDDSTIAMYGFYALGLAAGLTALPQALRSLLWGGRDTCWRYTLTDHTVEASTEGGVWQKYEYYALAYAHEAKDAFYLVANEVGGQAMILPKDALAPEQCAALREVLTRGMPGGRFTRWRGAE